MLIVAPIGSTNDEMRFETPALRSTLRIVTGSVAAEELVENAIAIVSNMLAKCTRGRMRPSPIRTRGSTTNMWNERPVTIVSA